MIKFSFNFLLLLTYWLRRSRSRSRRGRRSDVDCLYERSSGRERRWLRGKKRRRRGDV
jgi:hypothetical protein